ncbi:MAG: riboflavin synthase [Pseudomonadota bacterium]
MFTGIVTDVGRVTAVAEAEGLRRFRIQMTRDDGPVPLGASIACAGVCLTVVETGLEDGRTWFDVEAGFETLRATSAGSWSESTRINLERALKAGDEMGGHVVSGHVDGIAHVEAVEPDGGAVRYRFRMPQDVVPFVASKGSVTLDGTSLTVNEVEGDRFWVMMIPHTLAVTTWGERAAGDAVNIEVDMLARYVARLDAVRRSEDVVVRRAEAEDA